MRTATDLLRAHLHEMKSDFNAWRALYAEEAVMEYPYGAYAERGTYMTVWKKQPDGTWKVVGDIHDAIE